MSAVEQSTGAPDHGIAAATDVTFQPEPIAGVAALVVGIGAWRLAKYRPARRAPQRRPPQTPTSR